MSDKICQVMPCRGFKGAAGITWPHSILKGSVVRERANHTHRKDFIRRGLIHFLQYPHLLTLHSFLLFLLFIKTKIKMKLKLF